MKEQSKTLVRVVLKQPDVIGKKRLRRKSEDKRSENGESRQEGREKTLERTNERVTVQEKREAGDGQDYRKRQRREGGAYRRGSSGSRDAKRVMPTITERDKGEREQLTQEDTSGSRDEAKGITSGSIRRNKERKENTLLIDHYYVLHPLKCSKYVLLCMSCYAIYV